MKYGCSKQVDLPFSEAVERTKAELAKEGFGVLTEIDVAATLKKKLNIDYGKYLILGACNPPFAYQALQTEREVGLLLPCNVIVYEDSGKVTVSAILPTTAMSIVGNSALLDVAEQVEEKLQKVINYL